MTDGRPVAGIAFDIDQTLWDFFGQRAQALAACLELIAERATEPIDGWSIDDLQGRYDQHEATATGETLGRIRAVAMHEAAVDAAPGDPSLGDDLTELYFSIRHAPAPPYPDVPEALAQLRERGLLLGIISNGNTDLAAMGIAQFFDAVVLGPTIGMAKPEERIYREVERLLGVEPTALVCVGDDVHKDVVAPQQFGWRGVWNNRDGGRPPAGFTPDATVVTFDALVTQVDRWGVRPTAR